MPKPEYLYYETPYSSYKYEDYRYDTALSQASWINRQYEICAQGTGGPNKPANYTFCKMVPDLSLIHI